MAFFRDPIPSPTENRKKTLPWLRNCISSTSQSQRRYRRRHRLGFQLHKKHLKRMEGRPVPEVLFYGRSAQKRIHGPHISFLLAAHRAEARDEKPPLRARYQGFQVFQHCGPCIGKGARFPGGNFHKPHVLAKLADFFRTLPSSALRIFDWQTCLSQEFYKERSVLRRLHDGIDNPPRRRGNKSLQRQGQVPLSRHLGHFLLSM